MKLYSWFNQNNNANKLTSTAAPSNSEFMWPTATVNKDKPKIFYPKTSSINSKTMLKIQIKSA